MCVQVFESKERVRLGIRRRYVMVISVCVCVYREAVRTRAFPSSDGRIALLRPRRTDSV